jgi:hypothetical protein
VKLLPQNGLISALGLVFLVLTSFIFWLYITRTCPICEQKFALRELSRKHFGSRKYRGDTYHNIKSLYKCDFCGHEVVEEFVDVEERDEI